MAHDVFISYSSKDKKVADAVCATLEHRKIRCWIAPRDVLSGIPYAEALINAINESRIMVLVFSSNSNDSPQVMREVERAVDTGIPIIPFRIENVLPSKAIKYYLSALHWLDAITPPLEKHLRKLADTVQTLLAELEKPHEEGDEEKKEASKPETRTTTEKKRTRLWVTAGIVVVAVIVVVIILTVGGSGDGEDTNGLASGPTTTPATTPTTQGETSTSTTTPPVTPGTTTAGVTTTAGPTTTSSGKSLIGSTLQSGTSIQGEITFSGEVHWYTFDAQAGDAIYIVLIDDTENGPFVPWMGLLAPDGSMVWEDYDFSWGRSVQVFRWLEQDGSYSIRIRDEALGTGPYVLSFSLLSQTVQPITPGSIQGNLDFRGAVHWFEFDGKAGDTVYLGLVDSEDGLLNPWLTLVAPDGSLIFEDYDFHWNKSVQTDQVLPETGKYIIMVRDMSLIGGAYTLSFNIITGS
ncbi:MAG TPA: toll/interleukin-1 receptor domain-containing protein [Dehalococcoidia bacterium]|nr:toll/interleukin-1 receptor domain-containing protein [Dehalococcoidia bacterium]